MYTLTLSAVADVHRLKNRFRELCDIEGIRLGKTNEKVERILAGLLSVRDYNTLLGIAKGGEFTSASAGLQNVSHDVLRLALPRTTYGAKDRIIVTLRNTVGAGDPVISLVSFFHQKERLDYPVMGLWVKFASGRVFVFDSHQLNISNASSESDVISLYKHLSEVVPVNNWYYVAKRYDYDCCQLSIQELKQTIENAPVKIHALAWRELFPLAESDLNHVKKPAEVMQQWDDIFNQANH